jgi:phosphatidylglycerol---prolipoprotein diacylglyceryl transferase
MPSPVIFTIGPLELRWYGLFAALAALVFYVLMAVRAKRWNLDASKIADLMILIIITGLIGARLEYVRRFWDVFFVDDFAGIFRVWEGGLVFQGGFIVAALSCVVYSWLKKYPFGGVADLIALALPAAHAVARIGCFLNGCCFGRVWEHAGGVVYSAPGDVVLAIQKAQGVVPLDAAMPLPVLPVQLLESSWCALLALAIYWMERKKLFESQRFFIYVLFYSIGRFFLEFLRGDYVPIPTGGTLTPAQSTTLFFVLPAIILAMLITSYVKKRLIAPSHLQKKTK